tara:strand:+ start:439 stop:702 length:264 start_codon:yes stop_codon:yes gene_type:complete
MKNKRLKKKTANYESEPKTVLINLRKKICKDIDEVTKELHGQYIGMDMIEWWANNRRKKALLDILAYLDTELTILADNGHITKEILE